ncbi:MAG: M20/M25/M40 family metallo-hydrolase [Pirellulales bacterium]
MLILLFYFTLRRSYRLVGPQDLLLVAMVLMTGLAPVNGLASAGAAEWAKLDSALRTITTEELHSHAAALADDTFEGRAAGSRGGRATAGYLRQRLRSAGLKPGASGKFIQPFHGNYQNLLAVLPGADATPEEDGVWKHEMIIVGAHYDHVGYGNRQNSNGPVGYIHNGADDNASGVATLLEVIDALTHMDYRPQRSILFAFWDGEEKGLLGSKYWITHSTVPTSNISLMINIDMVGRMRDSRLEVIGTRLAYGMRKLLSSPRLPADMWLDFTWELKDNSDHWSFLEQQIPAICLHTGLHEDYHRPSDDIEKLNVVGIQQASRYLLARLTEIADSDQLPVYRSRGHRDSPASQRYEQRPLNRLAPRLGISWRYVEKEKSSHCLITGVHSPSPASKAGLRSGDEIHAINGRPVSGEGLLPAIVLQAPSEVQFSLVRSARSVESGNNFDHENDGLEQEIGGRAEKAESITVVLAGQATQLGLSWREDECEPQSVYVTRVVPYSPAARAGIQLGDRIYALNESEIMGQEDLFTQIRGTLAEKPETFQLTLETRGRIHQVEVNVGLPTGRVGDRSY